VHTDPQAPEAVQAELTTAFPDGAIGFPALSADPLRELHQRITREHA